MLHIHGMEWLCGTSPPKSVLLYVLMYFDLEFSKSWVLDHGRDLNTGLLLVNNLNGSIIQMTEF